MKQLTLRWPIAGVALGALAFVAMLFGIGAILNGVDIGYGFMLIVTVTAFPHSETELIGEICVLVSQPSGDKLLRPQASAAKGRCWNLRA